MARGLQPNVYNDQFAEDDRAGARADQEAAANRLEALRLDLFGECPPELREGFEKDTPRRAELEMCFQEAALSGVEPTHWLAGVTDNLKKKFPHHDIRIISTVGSRLEHQSRVSAMIFFEPKTKGPNRFDITISVPSAHENPEHALREAANKGVNLGISPEGLAMMEQEDLARMFEEAAECINRDHRLQDQSLMSRLQGKRKTADSDPTVEKTRISPGVIRRRARPQVDSILGA